MRTFARIVEAGACVLLFAAVAIAQPARGRAGAGPRADDARLLVTVIDQTGAVIPGAAVSIAPVDASAQPPASPSVKTSEVGVAMLAGLRPARYVVEAEFPGFEKGIVNDVRVRAGDNRLTIPLAIQKLEDSVTVGRDRQEAAADRGNSFGSALTREQIDALSDDPDLLRQQLQDLAGPGAVIRVDSFEGSPLPPKSQIKSIHITRDGFAAENHNAGAFFIDIVTQPGLGPIRGQTFYRLRDGSMSGRSPFTPVKGPERLQNYGVGFGGALAQEKSSFNLYMQGITSYETPNLNAALPGGPRSEALSLRSPRDNLNIQGLFDYAVTRDQTLRISFNQFGSDSRNLGIGAYDLPERAYSTTDMFRGIRVQEAGPLGRRFFINTRMNVSRAHNEQHANLEAPTIRVNDAFTSGGAQVAGGRDASALNVASDLDYVRGMHSMRVGAAIDTAWSASTLTSNYLGTYTFESLEAFEAGRPRSYTRRVGDPNIDYAIANAAIYVQDDIRIRKNLTLSPGVRYERQAHVRDNGNVGPRFGVTWAPFRSGKTTLRASAGIFYDWLNQNSYEQALRVDGFHQLELNLVDPAYPSVPDIGALPPVNRYFFAPNLAAPKNSRVSAGIEQVFTSSPVWTTRMNVLYTYVRGGRLWRGLNLNAPIDDVRQDPDVANVVEVVSDASSRQHQLTLGWNIGIPPQTPGNPSSVRWDWKRFAIWGTCIVTRATNDTDGDFSIPPTGALVDEWGRSIFDIPYRLNLNVTSVNLRYLTATVSVNGVAGTPYTIRTGLDDNGDSVFNDRPAGVSRNTVRAASQWAVNAYLQYSIPIRRRATAVPAGIMVTSVTGTTPTAVGTFSETARYRVTIIVQAQNLTDHRNYVGYSGVMTSPFFERPTAVANPRRIDMGIQFNF